jgi:hypothetical protein
VDATSDWVITVGHHPLVTYHTLVPGMEALRPILDLAKADAYICGHVCDPTLLRCTTLLHCTFVSCVIIGD